jgi:hypothetical protein
MVEGKICPILEFLKLGTADISLHYYFRVVVGGITQDAQFGRWQRQADGAGELADARK